MNNYNIKQNNKELSGEAFDYFMISFIKNRDELMNWKDKAVLGFYSQQENNTIFGNPIATDSGYGHYFKPEPAPFGAPIVVDGGYGHYFKPEPTPFFESI